MLGYYQPEAPNTAAPGLPLPLSGGEPPDKGRGSPEGFVSSFFFLNLAPICGALFN